jgi:hypothetical protein
VIREDEVTALVVALIAVAVISYRKFGAGFTAVVLMIGIVGGMAVHLL